MTSAPDADYNAPQLDPGEGTTVKLLRKAPTGMLAFTLIWIGQFASLLGSGMTGFGLSIWAWQATGQATALALAAFFFTGPTMLLSPLAGALVDRSNRKLVMMLSDIAAGLTTLALLILYATGHLQIWHIYVTNVIQGAFRAFQWPAYSAAMSTMLRKEDLGRANGMLYMAEAASGILAPVAAAALIGVIGIGGIFIVDIATLAFAILMLLLVHVPQPVETEAGRAGRGTLWQESGYGFRYILARPSLLGLQLTFFFFNLLLSFSGVLQAPMILSRTGNDTVTLGGVQSVAGVGMLLGGVVMSAWGGPKRRVLGVLGGMFFSALLGGALMGLGRSALVWSIAGFGSMFFLPICNGSSQAIWQSKVAPDVQGRVFATRLLIAQITAPVAMLAAGPLADRVFEPAMMPGGSLAGLFGGWVGTGPGAGMALTFVVTGFLGALVSIASYLVPHVRNAEDLLPDHDAATAS